MAPGASSSPKSCPRILTPSFPRPESKQHVGAAGGPTRACKPRRRPIATSESDDTDQDSESSVEITRVPKEVPFETVGNDEELAEDEFGGHLQKKNLEAYDATTAEFDSCRPACEKLEQWDEDDWPKIAQMFRDDEKARLLNAKEEQELARLAAPGITRTPFVHQVVCVYWWLGQEAGPFGAGLVGDEMGLGKVVCSTI